MNHLETEYRNSDACLAKEQIFDSEGRDQGRHICIWKGKMANNPQHNFHICFCGYTWDWEDD